MSHTIETLDYLEYVNVYKNRRLVRSQRKDWDDSSSWYGGTKSLDHTYDLAVNGWDAGIKLLEDDEDKIEVTGCTYTVNEVAGGLVDIGGYLVGRPDDMLQFVDEVDRSKPDLTLYIDLAYMGGFSEKDAMKYTKKVINIVNSLQLKYNLEIIGVFHLSGNELTSLFVNIKKYDDPFVLNSIVFAFHPSFFRRMWHYYLNTLEKAATGSGASLRSRGQVINAVKDYHKGNVYGGKKCWLLPSLQHHDGDMSESNYDKFKV